MREFQYYSPQGDRHGEAPFSVTFGNGTQIEAKVWQKAIEFTDENTLNNKKIPVLSRKHYLLSETPSGRVYSTGTDIIRVHFTPVISTGEKVNRRSMMSRLTANEVLSIALDCMDGYLSLAYALLANSFEIVDHETPKELYLFADTNRDFASFLRVRMGFIGKLGGTEAWMKKSNFTSNENMDHMHSQYAVLQRVRY